MTPQTPALATSCAPLCCVAPLVASTDTAIRVTSPGQAVIPCLHDVADAVAWLRSHVTGTLRTDSRAVQPGDGFIAWPGAATDGRAHVADALARGAAACLLEADGLDSITLPAPQQDADISDTDRVVQRLASFHGLKAAAGHLAAAWYGHPAHSLKVLAVTGTNGKTSTAWWLAHALAQQGCGMVGTLGVGVPPQVCDTGMTTPDAVRLQHILAGFAAQGLAACAMEASSIGIAEHRLNGVRLHTAIFTNCTQDHLDYHGNMDAYWQAKERLFDWPGLQAAVVNVDDPRGRALAAALSARGGLDVWTVGIAASDGLPLQAACRLLACNVRHSGQGLVFDAVEHDVHDAATVLDRCTVATQLIGQYNVSNLLGVLAALRTVGLSLPQAVAACAGLTPAPGRMQQIAWPGQPLVAVDYAHTPDALEQALRALRPVARQRGGRLWCVFGCGGNRDATKRPLMGAAAQCGADVVVVTSDNPRHENPEAILHHILQGMTNGQRPHVEVDRATAIDHAIAHAAPQDVVLLAGKGHEDYQDVQGTKHPFCDMAQARGALQRRAVLLPLEQVARWIGQYQPAGLLVPRIAGSVAVAGTQAGQVCTDSRAVQPGDLFVALKGDRVDAHQFLHQVAQRGAAAAIVQADTPQALRPAGLPLLEVADTTAALGAWATGWRSQFSLPLIAVTGSNGKTTVTQMVASILAAHVGPQGAFATLGNFNNAIGVPLTLLRLTSAHRAGVVELGMNHPGEIAVLARMAQPTVALVNNAQREHQEFMHTVQAVAEENGSVFNSLPADGVAVFPAKGEYAPLWRKLAGSRRVLTFGADPQADVRLAAMQWRDGAWHMRMHTPAGDCATVLHIAGQHNVDNALAATACALAAGVPLAAIARGLEDFRPVVGRSRLTRMHCHGHDVDIVDDTYNANPDSVLAAIAVLASLPAPRLLVLGDMAEVGGEGPAFHREAGTSARAAGIDALLAVGPQARHAVTAFGAGGMHFHDMPALLTAVPGHMHSARSVLVKGSRSMKMEQVVRLLQAACVQSPVPASAADVSFRGAGAC